MAELGKGYINVVPKFPGLASSINAALDGVGPRNVGAKWGNSFSKGVSGGVAKSGAAVGVFSALTNTAISSITSNLNAAISRFDTLNNYPRVMQSLGYSSDEADASIKKMSDRLQGLPTKLDSMAKTVQGFSVITKDLDLATEAGLALNDMLLASGSSQQLVTSAAEQFRQMLSKGKPDMQDWKSLTQAMPGQLDQLAKSMLGPTANANDLYAALGGGKGNKAKFTMNDLLKQIIKLDKEGGNGFASFEEQARQATGGVQTSMENLGTAISRGIAGVMDAVGQDTIAGVFNDLKGGINDAFGTIQGVVSDNAPQIKSFATSLKDVAPSAIAAGAGLMVFQTAGNHLPGIINKGKQLKESFELAAGGAGSLSESLRVTGAVANPAGFALGLAGAAAGILAMKAYEAYQRQEQFKLATTGLSDALSDTLVLDNYSARISGIGSSSGSSKKSIEELTASISAHAENIQETNKTAESQIATLNTARDVITQYSGNTDLSNDAQGRLKWAIQQVNEQLGLNITATDVANGKYTDQNGKVQDLTKSIDDLVEAKKREIKTNALTNNLQETYDAIDDQTEAVVQQRKEVQRLQQIYDQDPTQANKTYLDGAINKYDELNRSLENTKKGAKDIEEQLGDTSKAADESADSFDKLADSNSIWLATLRDNGHSLSGLKTDLQALGVDTEKFAKLSDDQLQQVVDAYDGSAVSIIDALSRVGIYISQDKETLARNAKELADTLNGMDLSGIESLNGIDLDDFSLKLAEAGVSTQTIKDMGTENFAALAERCGYDFDLMTAAIATYNNTPIVDKDGNITIDQTTLLDAQGNVYAWNGTTLEDKNGNAVVDDVRLMDAQGHVVEWNGSKLNNLTGNASVGGNLKSALADANAWNNLKLANHAANAVINFAGSAIGALLRGNAAGGIRYHADGAIVTKPTMISPQDIAGEAGAEAIVPLTNRKYSKPFADVIAEGVNERLSASKSINQTFNIYSSDAERVCAIVAARERRTRGF